MDEDLPDENIMLFWCSGAASIAAGGVLAGAASDDDDDEVSGTSRPTSSSSTTTTTTTTTTTEDTSMAAKVSQRQTFFFGAEYWQRPNPFFLGPKRVNGDYIGVKVIPCQYLKSRMDSYVHQIVGVAKYLKHENVVKVLGSITTSALDGQDQKETKSKVRKDPTTPSSTYVLVWQQHVEGRTLADMIASQWSGLDEHTVRVYYYFILSGLSYLHENQIYHQKLRSSKVIIDRDGIPVILDYAFPPCVYKDAYQYKHSSILAPEVLLLAAKDGLENSKFLAEASDIWSLGLMLLEVLTGQEPIPLSQVGKVKAYFEKVQKTQRARNRKKSSTCTTTPSTSRESTPSLPVTPAVPTSAAGETKPPEQNFCDQFAEDSAVMDFIEMCCPTGTLGTLSEDALGFLLQCLRFTPDHRASLSELRTHSFVQAPEVLAQVHKLQEVVKVKREIRMQATVDLLQWQQRQEQEADSDDDSSHSGDSEEKEAQRQQQQIANKIAKKLAAKLAQLTNAESNEIAGRPQKVGKSNKEGDIGKQGKKGGVRESEDCKVCCARRNSTTTTAATTTKTTAKASTSLEGMSKAPTTTTTAKKAIRKAAEKM